MSNNFDPVGVTLKRGGYNKVHKLVLKCTRVPLKKDLGSTLLKFKIILKTLPAQKTNSLPHKPNTIRIFNTRRALS